MQLKRGENPKESLATLMMDHKNYLEFVRWSDQKYRDGHRLAEYRCTANGPGCKEIVLRIPNRIGGRFGHSCGCMWKKTYTAGGTYGRFQLIKEIGKKDVHSVFEAVCLRCGKQVEVDTRQIRKQQSPCKCGCKKRYPSEGAVIGRFQIQHEAGRTTGPQHRTLWAAVCLECGTEVEVTSVQINAQTSPCKCGFMRVKAPKYKAGETYGRFRLTRMIEKKNRCVVFEAVCLWCGKNVEVSTQQIGKQQSPCRCTALKKDYKTNEVVGRFQILRPAASTDRSKGRALWAAICSECGTEVEITSAQIFAQKSPCFCSSRRAARKRALEGWLIKEQLNQETKK